MITQMGNIKIEIQRRKIKNMNIYIKPPKGDVLVTVPMRISDEEVFRFLKKKEQWILKNHEKMFQTALIKSSIIFQIPDKYLF